MSIVREVTLYSPREDGVSSCSVLKLLTLVTPATIGAEIDYGESQTTTH
jgi:hypothetical protein